MTALLWCLLGAASTSILLYGGFRLVLRDERAKRQALFDRTIRLGEQHARLYNQNLALNAQVLLAESRGFLTPDYPLPLGATPRSSRISKPGRVPAELFDADRTR